MINNAQQTAHQRALELRQELDRMREEARKLHGEARLQADQHINKLNDRIEELEGGSAEALEGAAFEDTGLKEAFRNAWADIADSAEKTAEEIRRKIDTRH